MLPIMNDSSCSTFVTNPGTRAANVIKLNRICFNQHSSSFAGCLLTSGMQCIYIHIESNYNIGMNVK